MQKYLVLLYHIILLTVSNIGEGQWKLVGPNTIGARLEVGKSLYDLGAVTYTDGIIWAGRSELYYSPDTGKNWIFVNTPHENNYDNIVSISFYNKQIGVVQKEYSGYLLTTDMGQSWTKLPLNIGGYSSQCIGPPLRIFLFGYYSILLSEDTGKTWVEVSKYKSFGVGSCKTNTPVLMSVADGSSYITYNSGIQWQQQPGLISTDTWSLASDSCLTPTIYAANEQLAADDGQPSRLYSTTNLGITWNIICQRPLPFFSGSVEVIGDIIYAQTSIEGIYRSTDKGTTWKSIGGPCCGVDSRCIAIINENTIVAADSSGNIFITENSGGFPIAKKKDIAIIQVPQFDTTSCSDKIFSKIIISNPNCGTLILDLSTIAGFDTTFFTIESDFPIIIPEGKSDTIIVSFNPHSSVGTRNINVELLGHVSSAYGTRAYDTTIAISGISRALPPKLTSSSISYNLGTASTCNQVRDTVIMLRNTGCDTLCITQGPGTIPSEFTINTLSYPHCLPPDSSVMINVRFTPSGAGTFRAYPKYRAEQQGLTQDVELFLEGTGIEEGGELAYQPKSFTFPLTSICSRDSAFGFIANIGCDTIVVESTSLTGDIDFTSTTIGSNILLAPGDTLRYRILFTPSVKGNRSAQLILSSKNNLPSRRDTIPVTATVTDGTRILASSPPTLDFGTTTVCEERDSLVTLRNTGCDTLRVTGVGVQGIGFSSNVTTPIIIPPGGSVTIPVTTIVDTSQGNISTGTITFISDADNQVTPITLSRGYTYPKSYSFHIAMLDATATSGEIVRLAIVGEQGLGSSGSGVNRLDFDLTLNEDLLEYIRPEGSNTVNKNGTRITISNTNELTSIDDTLAILVYHVYLTKDSATDITVSSISINNGDTSRCAPKIAGITQAGFTYRYECGDKHIQSFLRTGKASLEITSIRPNPAREYVSLEVHSVEKQSVTVEIFDALGNQHSHFTTAIIEGNNVISASLSELPSGTYIARITAGAETTSARFVVSD